MTVRRIIDVSALPDFEISSNAPLWWGQASLAIVEGSMFCILIAIYFYYRLGLDIWPPPGIELPHRVLPAIAVVFLLLSCIGSYLASEAAKRNDRGGMIVGLCLNLVLASAAMGFRARDWSSWNFNWKSSAYGSIVWGILFLHSLDVIADLLFTLTLIIIVSFVRAGPPQRLGVHVDSIVWYFLVAIWLALYVTVDWTPYFWGGPL
jgi:heme/copper-type cytochrome/quinol oxidase subunit 3